MGWIVAEVSSLKENSPRAWYERPLLAVYVNNGKSVGGCPQLAFFVALVCGAVLALAGAYVSSQQFQRPMPVDPERGIDERIRQFDQ